MRDALHCADVFVPRSGAQGDSEITLLTVPGEGGETIPVFSSVETMTAALGGDPGSPGGALHGADVRMAGGSRRGGGPGQRMGAACLRTRSSGLTDHPRRPLARCTPRGVDVGSPGESSSVYCRFRRIFCGHRAGPATGTTSPSGLVGLLDPLDRTVRTLPRAVGERSSDRATARCRAGMRPPPARPGRVATRSSRRRPPVAPRCPHQTLCGSTGPTPATRAPLHRV